MTVVKTVAVLGAGTMGAGIAQVCARAGHTTLLFDVNATTLERARTLTGQDLGKLVSRGKLSGDERDATLGRLSYVGTLEELAGAQVVIEAVPEVLELKRTLFADLERVAPGAVLASNTSTLSIAAIFARLERPERGIGLHFFNPAPVLPLVEVIPSDFTHPTVTEQMLEFVRGLGKTPVQARDTPGFIVNRIARPFYGEGMRLLEESAAPETVDRVLRGAGFKMGPLELMDLIGLDVNLAATKSVYEASFHDPRYRPNPIQQRMVDSERLGRKTGRGFYKHETPR